MPLYEWQCGRGHHFEMLTTVQGARRAQQCPECGARSQRMISTFAIQSGAQIATASERAVARDVDVTSLKVPAFARPCGMDDYSAARFAAHKAGRGTEFDDKMAARKERETAAPGAPKKPKPKHSH